MNHIALGSKLYTDDASYLRWAAGESDFIHEVVSHAREYVRGQVHTQGIENFWSLLKRTLRGTYVAVEPFHLDRYLDEQVFRFNNRATKDNPLNDEDRFAYLMSQVGGKRLTYATLTGKGCRLAPPPDGRDGGRGTLLTPALAALFAGSRILLRLRCFPRSSLRNLENGGGEAFKVFPCFRTFDVFVFLFHHMQIMRLLVIATIALAFLPAGRSQQQQPANSKQGAASQPPSNPSITGLDNHYHAAEQTNSTAEQPPRWPPPWYSTLWPNWAFVLVGFATALAALWTLRAMKKQAAHLGEQVELLKQQLAAFVEGQRPQIAADPHGNPARDILDPEGARIQIDISNVGLTTAYDVTWESWIEVIVPPFTDFSSKAAYYSQKETFSLLPKHKPMTLNVPLRRDLSERERKHITVKSREMEVCVRILVKYRDAFEPNRWANFGYIVDSEGFRFLSKYHDSN